MDTATVDAVRDALRTAADRFDVDVRREPNRTLAIVADLTGQPGRSSANSIGVLRAALTVAAAHRGPMNARQRAKCVAEAAALGVDAADAATMFDLLGDVLDPADTDRGPGGSNGKLRLALVAVLIVTTGFVLWFLNRPTPQPSTVISPLDTSPLDTSVGDDEVASTTLPPDPDSTLPPAPTPDDGGTADTGVALIASFDPVVDGNFLVERQWRTSGSEFVATIRLSNPGDASITSVHREFAPPVPGSSTAEWTPAPTNLIATTAVYSQVVLAPGEQLEIVYRSATTVTDPTEQDLLSWYETWKSEAEGLNSVLGTPPEFAPPTVRTE